MFAAEGMPNSVLEYMAAGRPIVAVTVGAVPQLIADGVHGLLVPPGDVESLAKGVQTLLQTPEEAARLGNAARERVRRHYSRAAMIERFEGFYQSLPRTGEWLMRIGRFTKGSQRWRMAY